MLLIVIWTWMIIKSFFQNPKLKAEDMPSDNEEEVKGKTEMENSTTTTQGCFVLEGGNKKSD